MVEVEKYIKRLLYDQDCVIIPEFGGVLTHYLPARFDAASGKYLPSQRKVAFNEVLKIDDGLLAKYISQNEGMSYEQAQRHIRDFVQTMQTLLKRNKVVSLNGVGSFQMNEEGRLFFQPDPFRNFHSEFYGLSAVSALDRRNAPITDTVSEDLEVEERVTHQLANTTRRVSWGNWISAASIACVLVYVSAVLSSEPGATSSMSPLETVRSLFTKSAEKETVLEISGEDNAESTVLPAVVDNSPAEEANEGAVKEEVVSTVVDNEDRKFHVIASVYESKSSLEKYGEQMARKLHTLGFEDIKTLTVREKYMLSAGSFRTWNEAQKALPALTRNAKGAWIYKQK